MRNSGSTVRRSLVLLVLTAVLPTLIVAAGALLYAYKEEQEGFQKGVIDTTRALALVVDREIARREAIALTLAGSPTLTRGDLKSFHEYASNIAPTRDKVVILQDLTGQQLVNTRLPLGAELPRTQLSKEREAAGPRATVVSNLYFAPVGKQYSFAVQVPVVREDRVRYYLTVAGFVSALQSIMEDQRLPEGWVASILDAKGVIVARSHHPERFVGKPTSDRLAAQLARREEGVFESMTVDGVPILATYSRSPAYGWSVVMGVPLRIANAPLKVVAGFGVLAALLLSLTVLAALATGRRLLSPVQRLKDASAALGSGRAVDVAPTGLQETDQVLASMHEASGRIDRANSTLEMRRQEAEAAAAALRHSEERLLQLANTIPNLAWMANADGWITWYNDRWYEYTGTTPVEMEGWGWQKVHDPDVLPLVMARWQKSIATGEPFEMTFPLRGKDGVFRPFFTRVAPLREASGAIKQWFGTNTDVSTLKEAEDELRRAARRKDEFLAMLAHELRNPLAPIRNAAEILRRSGSAEPNVAKASEIIARHVGHMSGLLNDLLDVSRITRGLVTVDRERLEMAEIIAAAVEQVRPLIDAREHRLLLELQPGPAAVLASRLRMTQVIANLLDNAAKYSAPGGQIRVELRIVESHVRIVVADTGAGISEELLPHVFEPFTQAERGSDRSASGLGLGLAVVKGLVELQGGTVTAQSDGLGKGSRFVVELPLADPAAAAPPEASKAAAAAAPQGPRRVLIVDDNADAADTLALLLRGLGHRADCAYTGRQALDLIGRETFDIAFLDIGLPDMTGYELAKTIQDSPEAPTLVALSGYGQRHDRSHSRAAGFALHLVKPVEPDSLLDALASI